MKQFHFDKIINYAYYALLFFLPLSIFMDNVALIILVLLTIFSKKRIAPLNYLLWSSLFLFFVYILFLGVLNLNLEVNEYIKLLPLLFLPLVLFHLSKETLLRGLLFLFVAIIIQQFISIYGICHYYWFTEGKTVALRSYAGINEILHFERPYLGFFSALNIIISYLLFKKGRLWMFALTSVFSIFIIVLISARLGLLIAIMALLTILISRIRMNRKYWLVLIGFMGIAGTLFFTFNSPLKNRFQQLKYDTRFVVWQGAFQILEAQNNPLFGLKSQSELNNKLLSFYKNEAEFEYKPDRLRFITKSYNTHNQFINEILRGGILGFLLLILPFGYLIYKNLKSNQLEMTLMLIAIVLFFMVENLLYRQIGVYTTAIILSLSRKLTYEKN